jgi:hypothetical protein
MTIPAADGYNLDRLSSWRSKADAKWAIKKLVLYYNDALADFLKEFPGEQSHKFMISNHQPLTIYDFEVVKKHRSLEDKRRTKNVS